MTTTEKSATHVMLGDEAVALGALHAGVTAAYGYPGTPSTEILEYLLRTADPGPKVAWCANEKTAYEAAVGVSMVGRRALVTMKHVGLNVAADPFINSALVEIGGGLVVAVADDPGMHSSQNEQDSRYYADFARILCLEPADQQQAYEMTREAFDFSEQFHIPVMIRLVTRLAHSRSVVAPAPPHAQLPLGDLPDGSEWTLLPANARRRYADLLSRQPALLAHSERVAALQLAASELGVITTGIARNYFLEHLTEIEDQPSHLHIGTYPIPVAAVRRLAGHVDRIVVLEDGYPYVERLLRGLLPEPLPIDGKLNGRVPAGGELDPDVVRQALDLPDQRPAGLPQIHLAERPPQLCRGCPHADSFHALIDAMVDMEGPLVCSDIGCYTLGALPPYRAIQSCVCMGASIGMARGAADAGYRPAIAVIGDSTFLHSGMTPLLDAVADDTDLTVLILDNHTIAMTGAQPTLVPSERLPDIIRGLGVDPDHLHVLRASRKGEADLIATIKKELDHPGVSVVIAERECIELVKRDRKERS
jgi:indolepyruvate ferredoxin oxidoreductase alpha subunit